MRHGSRRGAPGPRGRCPSDVRVGPGAPGEERRRAAHRGHARRPPVGGRLRRDGRGDAPRRCTPTRSAATSAAAWPPSPSRPRHALLDDERAAAAVLAGLYRAIPLTRHGRSRAPVPAGRPRVAPAERAAARGAQAKGGRAAARHAGERQPLRRAAGGRDGAALADAPQRLAGDRPGDPRPPPGEGRRRPERPALPGSRKPGGPGLPGGHGTGRSTTPTRAGARWWRRCARSSSACWASRRTRRPTSRATTTTSASRSTTARRSSVHRKGAISAAAGEDGLVPGSMGTRSYHVEGRGCAEALCSSAHGAGRRLSRTDARRALSARDVTRELRGVWFDHRLAAAPARGSALGLQGHRRRPAGASRARSHRPPAAAGAELQGGVESPPSVAGGKPCSAASPISRSPGPPTASPR